MVTSNTGESGTTSIIVDLKRFCTSFTQQTAICHSKENSIHLRYIAALRIRILDLSSACFDLIHSRQFTAVPIIFRTTLEAFVDIYNLDQRGEDYFYIRISDHLKNKERLSRAVREIYSDFSGIEITQLLRVMDERSKFEKELAKQLKDRKLGPSSNRQRFEIEGLENLYIRMYPLVCMHSHNDLQVLETTHLNPAMEEDSNSESYYRSGWSKDFINGICQFLVTIIQKSQEISVRNLELKDEIPNEMVTKHSEELIEKLAQNHDIYAIYATD